MKLIAVLVLHLLHVEHLMNRTLVTLIPGNVHFSLGIINNSQINIWNSTDSQRREQTKACVGLEDLVP